jgi:hypothetical protein
MTLEKPGPRLLAARERIAARGLTGAPGRAYSFGLDLGATLLAVGAYGAQRAAGLVSGRQRRNR